MQLAKELLERGERDTVIKFFRSDGRKNSPNGNNRPLAVRRPTLEQACSTKRASGYRGSAYTDRSKQDNTACPVTVIMSG